MSSNALKQYPNILDFFKEIVENVVIDEPFCNINTISILFFVLFLLVTNW